jgi:hypothetical protein
VFPQGFLGTRADLLFDIIVVSLILIVPLLIYSLYLVRVKKDYVTHKNIQVGVSIVVAIVLVLFEMNLYFTGGVEQLLVGSSYQGTSIMDTIMKVHLFFSISTAILWPVVLISALVKMPKPPRPTPDSKRHRILGWIAFFDMIGTGVTGVIVYAFIFVL